LAPETLSLRGVSASYRQVQVLRGVDLDLPAGSSLAVLGANGAGKTTLLRAISGIMVRREGSLTFGETSLHRLKAHEIVRHGISQVPEGKHLFRPLSVSENLEIGTLPLQQLGRKNEAAVARELVFDLFPILAKRSSQAAGTLSGGEQQMLAIGRALMSRPKILLLDEPSVGLAPRVNEQLFAALARLRGFGVSIVVAEQLVKLACDLAEQAVVMHLGRIAMAGKAVDIKNDPELKRLYLGG
jgi:branched-chain amino acid transport system ATP-binding protein